MGEDGLEWEQEQLLIIEINKLLGPSILTEVPLRRGEKLRR